MYDIDLESLAQPKAYLCKVVTNHCLDLLQSARKRRVQYFGEWLPEPIVTANDELFESVARGELLSYAMLVLLEKLSPAERAVFVLREALSFEYDDIAQLIGKSEANCRKLNSRARGKMGIEVDQPIHPDTSSEQWVYRFMAALEEDNVDAIVSMLAKDVVLVSDGGGKAHAAVRPIETSIHVARFLLGLFRKTHTEATNEGLKVAIMNINGQAGVVFRSGERIETIALLHADGNVIRNIYFMRNPDKMRHL